MINSNTYIGKLVEVKIDRPMGSKHPKHGLYIQLIMDMYQIL